jgi:N6-L-threonylcarbamoyladenine synthase
MAELYLNSHAKAYRDDMARREVKTAGIQCKDLSGIAVCYGPGLIGSLLVGCSFAKALCYSTGVPLIAVNHLEGHVFSAFLETNRLSFPFISLIVSGGHTCLYQVDDFGYRSWEDP